MEYNTPEEDRAVYADIARDQFEERINRKLATIEKRLEQLEQSHSVPAPPQQQRAGNQSEPDR